MIEDILSNTEQLGVIGSPSSTTELAIDIIGSAVTRKLVGELALFRFEQDSLPHYAMGQITEVQLRNVWHEDPTIRSLIRQRGRVDAVTERQDTHLGKMTVSAVFKNVTSRKFEPSLLGTVPSTGTPIHIVNDAVLDEVLAPYKPQMFYLGHVYGSTPKLPMWFKHFDSGPDGNGEAYHIGIFGKTGSGKSVLAKMVLAGYARYPEMGILIIDPQGEYTGDVRSHLDPMVFNFSSLISEKEIAKAGSRRKERVILGKEIAILDIDRLVLDRWDLFEEVLDQSRFFEKLTIRHSENRRLATTSVREFLEKKAIPLTKLSTRETFALVIEHLAKDDTLTEIYPSKEPRERLKKRLEHLGKDELFANHWRPVTLLFCEDRGAGKAAKTVDKALNWLLGTDRSSETGELKSRPILVINLSAKAGSEFLWNERIEKLVIKRLLDGLVDHAEALYTQREKRQGDKIARGLNTLVVLDEAHRFAPREVVRDDDAGRSVRRSLIDAVRTTRKYGLGWMFISQTLSSMDTEITQQMRIYFFGFGLGLGQEYQSLRQLAGSTGTALGLYQLFRDPQSAFHPASKQFSFMAIGPVSPLAFSSTPLFFNAFNTVDAFLEANNLR